MHTLVDQLEQAKADNTKLYERNALLEQENRWLKQQIFGRSSEKRTTPVPANQEWLFNEADAMSAPREEIKEIRVPAHTRKTPGRKPIAADIPRVNVVHDLTKAEKICPKDGTALTCIGDETSEQIDFIPARVQVIRHVRLKYACPCCKSHVALAEKQPEISARANVALDYIGRLYGIERELKEAKVPPTPEQHLEIRQHRSAPIMAEFKAWLDELAPNLPPKMALGIAVHYVLGQWAKLCVFLDHPIVPLDNNRCENAIRPFVIGRTNWLFSDTQAGATASARLYSLVETAKANRLEPHAYLTHLYTHLPAATSADDFEALLPWNVKLAPAHPRAPP